MNGRLARLRPLDELRDPESLEVDLEALHGYTGPALLTHSDNSPPMFAPILDKVATALPQAKRHLYLGGGHIPHAVQPDEYARVTLPHVLDSA